VNDTFLACVEEQEGDVDAVRVFCFDEHVQMAGAESTGLWE